MAGFFGRRLNLPLRRRADRHGGFGRWLNLPHHEFLVPIPPPPFPHGEGGDFGFSYARGFAPCIPGTEPGRRGGGGAILHQAGGLPRRCRITLPSLSPMGGTAVLVAGFTSHITKFYPLSPRPALAERSSPHGEGGDFWFSYARGFAPCIPGLNPGGAGAEGAILRQAGGLPRRCRITLPSLSPTGGGERRFWSPAEPAAS